IAGAVTPQGRFGPRHIDHLATRLNHEPQRPVARRQVVILVRGQDARREWLVDVDGGADFAHARPPSNWVGRIAVAALRKKPKTIDQSRSPWARAGATGPTFANGIACAARPRSQPFRCTEPRFLLRAKGRGEKLHRSGGRTLLSAGGCVEHA